jgi:hypothetical protein
MPRRSPSPSSPTLATRAKFPGAVILFVIYIIATRSFYSIFTSSAYRNRDAKWRFPQEIATLAEAKTQAREVKML